MEPTILITGATGTVASLLIPQLAARELPLRAMVHHEAKAEPLRAGGIEAVVADYDRPDTLARALERIGTVFLVTPPNPQSARWTSNFLEAAKKAGAPRIVRMSVIKAGTDAPTDNARLHGESDDQLLASGLKYVILRPHFFMQNLFASAPTIQSDGVMYWGMGAGRLGMIDARDIADTAARVLTDPAFDGGIFPLTGPESISFQDVAGILSEALGRPVTYHAVPPEAVERSLQDMGAGDWQARVMRQYSQAYSAGWGDFTTPDVERITGHPPRAFANFAREVIAPAIRSK